MATYNFDTITAAEALALGAGDRLIFSAGSAHAVDVWYDAATSTIAVVQAGRSVVFGAGLAGISHASNIAFPDGSALFIGGGGSESQAGSAWNDGLFGGGGGDSLAGDGGRDFLQGNMGADTLYGGDAADAIYGGRDDDVIETGIGGDFGHGNMGNDTLTGGPGADTLLGGQHNDLVDARDGHNYVSGDLGHDRIRSGGGNDTLFGGSGDDSITDLGGGALIDGGVGDDYIVLDFGRASATSVAVAFGGDGIDVIEDYHSGAASLSGGAGHDMLGSAGEGEKVLDGGPGDDIFQVAIGNTLSFGGEGRDFFVPTIIGSGNHTFHGGADEDILVLEGDCVGFGGDGDDRLIISRSQNVADGGAGRDRFEVKAETLDRLEFQGVIEGWSTGEDVIVISGMTAEGFRYAEASATNLTSAAAEFLELVSSGVTVAAFQFEDHVILLAETSGTGGSDVALLLRNTSLDDISGANFVF